MVSLVKFLKNNTYQIEWSMPLELSSPGNNTIFQSEINFQLTSIDSVVINSKGTSSDKLLLTEIRYFDGDIWSQWTVFNLPLSIETTNYIEVKVTRIGTNRRDDILISDVIISGKYNSEIIPSTEILLENNQSTVILQNPDIFKVFKLTDYLINGDNLEEADVEFRFSQTQGRNWTDWYYLSQGSIRALRPDPMRFFLVQYRITKKTTNPVHVYSIDLIGDFINVSDNYKKSSRLGIRSDCVDNTNNDPKSPNCNPYPALLKAKPCDTSTSFWTPYDKNLAIQLYQFQANLVQSTLGWTVDYYKTNPDRKGRDLVLNEYGLLTYDCCNKIKVIVPNNKFPDNQLEFNSADLSDMQEFEIHILRDEFKNNFGIETRPDVGDLIFFCETNRLYRIEGAGMDRKFMNATVYYRVILRKYNNETHVDGNNAIGEQIKELTKQSTFKELIGEEYQNELKKIANKPLHKPLDKDPIRTKNGRKAKRTDYDLYSGPNLIVKRYYDLTNIPVDEAGVVYKVLDNEGSTSSSRTIHAWFNLNLIAKRGNILHNHDGNSGYKLDVDDRGFYLLLNQREYFFETTVKLQTWLNVVVCFDQNKKTVRFWLYRRKNEVDPSTGSDPTPILVNELTLDLIEQITWNHLEQPSVLGGAIYLTHIRLWKTELVPYQFLPELTATMVDDADMCIIADNVDLRTKAKSYIPFPDPQQLSPPSSEDILTSVEIKVQALERMTPQYETVTDKEFELLTSEFRTRYIIASKSIGITDYKFYLCDNEQLDFIYHNYLVLTDTQFNSLDDSNKILFIDRIYLNNPMSQWIVPGVTPYAQVSDAIFSQLTEIVVDELIVKTYRFTQNQWNTLLIQQKEAYMNIGKRPKLVYIMPRQNTETLAAYEQRLDQGFKQLKMPE